MEQERQHLIRLLKDRLPSFVRELVNVKQAKFSSPVVGTELFAELACKIPLTSGNGHAAEQTAIEDSPLLLCSKSMQPVEILHRVRLLVGPDMSLNNQNAT